MVAYIKTAELVYIPQAIGVVNPTTGRVTRQLGTPETIDISIEQRDVKSTIFSKDGRDIIGTQIAGRLLPVGQPFPAWYRPGLDCTIRFTDGTEARFYAMVKTPSRFGLEAVFGQRITGFVYNASQSNEYTP